MIKRACLSRVYHLCASAHEQTEKFGLVSRHYITRTRKQKERRLGLRSFCLYYIIAAVISAHPDGLGCVCYS